MARSLGFALFVPIALSTPLPAQATKPCGPSEVYGCPWQGGKIDSKACATKATWILSGRVARRATVDKGIPLGKFDYVVVTRLKAERGIREPLPVEIKITDQWCLRIPSNVTPGTHVRIYGQGDFKELLFLDFELLP